MRVTYFSSSTVPSRTANSVHVMKMAEALGNIGAAVNLIVRIRAEEEFKTGTTNYLHYGVDEVFSITQIPWEKRNSSSALLYALRGLQQLVRDGSELVLSRNLLGSWLSTLFGFETVHESHSPEHLEGTLKRLLFRTLMRRERLRAVVVISAPLKELFLSSGLTGKKPIIVLPDGADAGRNPLPPRSASRQPETFVAGYAGSLYVGRGISLIASLAQNCKWAKFVVAGGDHHTVERLRNRYRNIKNLEFLGHLPPAEVEGFLRNCSALLAPYQADTSDAAGHNTSAWMSPLKIFEYMASGRPMIASDLPVLGEVLSHEENALLAPASDVEAWRAALNRLRIDVALGTSISHQAFDDLNQHYSWDQRAKRLAAAVF